MNHTILIIIITVFQKDNLLEDDRPPRYSCARVCMFFRLVRSFDYQFYFLMMTFRYGKTKVAHLHIQFYIEILAHRFRLPKHERLT